MKSLLWYFDQNTWLYLFFSMDMYVIRVTVLWTLFDRLFWIHWFIIITCIKMFNFLISIYSNILIHQIMHLSILNTILKKKCNEFFNSGIMVNAFWLFSLYFQVYIYSHLSKIPNLVYPPSHLAKIPNLLFPTSQNCD